MIGRENKDSLLESVNNMRSFDYASQLASLFCPASSRSFNSFVAGIF